MRDKLRGYNIVIDGQKYGKINSGDTETINIAPGHHTMWLTIDWCRSNKVDFYLEEGQTIDFNCRSNMEGPEIFLAILFITILANEYLILEKV